MNRRNLQLGGIGCGALLLLMLTVVAVLMVLPFQILRNDTSAPVVSEEIVEPLIVGTSQDEAAIPQDSIPTLAPPSGQASNDSSPSAQPAPNSALLDLAETSDLLTRRYQELNPGVVNIGVIAQAENGQQGSGAGSGFVLNENGYIVTNNHVVDQATEVVAIFFNGLQARAEIIGTDDDSDLAVIKVDQLPEGVHPLPVADSDTVQVGDWAIAIGNPNGLGSSMTLGIVSAIGRSIPSGATPFSIPQAIQTDAAINPGNSGGPLINLDGQVIGVNAQIRTGGSRGNTGVGFAIPANVVRHVAPVLIANGFYDWPWLGVEGAPVGLTLMEANNLDTQQGAYIVDVVPGGPADKAGLVGAEIVERNGILVPVGGDVVVAIDGEPVVDFADLSSRIAFKSPDGPTVLTILREGRRQDVTVALEARPSEFN